MTTATDSYVCIRCQVMPVQAQDLECARCAAENPGTAVELEWLVKATETLFDRQDLAEQDVRGVRESIAALARDVSETEILLRRVQARLDKAAEAVLVINERLEKLEGVVNP